MYKFACFTEKDQSAVIAFMKANPFAVIAGCGEHYPVATQVPLDVGLKDDGKVFLSGHMMKNTDHHLAFEKRENVLVLFNGPHSHVSASWYINPARGSTWNYMTVHAKGRIRFKDAQGTYNILRDITAKYEESGSPAAFDQLPLEYISKRLEIIAGFTIEVDELNNIFKLSQDRDEASKKNVIEQLKRRGDDNALFIAEEMAKRL